MRRVLSLTAAGVAIAAGITLSVLPIRGFLGLDAASLGALEVAVATLLATVLVWYGLRTE